MPSQRSNVIPIDSRGPQPMRARKMGAYHSGGGDQQDAAEPGRKYQQGQGFRWQGGQGNEPPTPINGPSVVDLNTGQSTPFTPESDDVRRIEIADGAVIIDFGGEEDEDEPERERGFDENLALDMDESELSAIAAEILDGIRQDEESRKDVLETRAKGIKLLGLKIEEARGDAGTSSAPLEGMATVRHPILLEACTTFQAGARGELLPSAGPCKVRVDAPPGAPMGPPGQPPQAQGTQPLDELAQALETDMNHYLTDTATEYVPDHDRMLFGVGFSGDGFVKGYHHPLKRRPVIETIDPEDLIVSNMATDLQSCGRVTHRMRMGRSVLRRMQLFGGYRDIHLQQAVAETPDVVKQETADVIGARVEPQRPKDVDYTLYESYVELDLDEFAPKQFKGKALPLPYRVTIEKDSRQVLEITRDWKEDDKLCERRKTFVQYPFIPAFGFYSLGFVHLIGNSTLALTAIWREMLDAGMFANFPGFMYDKAAGRQLSNQFRCPPGGGIPLEVPPGKTVDQVAKPLPYKEIGPAFPAFAQHVEQSIRQTAMAANAPVAEGKQDAPVGTTLALIEQATKVLGAAFKRLHSAQAQELRLLVDLFREDPEAFWRHNRKPARAWQKAQFLAALDKWELVPVADPNNPTSLHRLAKAAMLKTLQGANPQIYDPIAVDRRIMTMSGIDPEGLFAGPQPQGPDPMMMLLQLRVQLEQTKLAQKDKELQLKALTAAMQQQGKVADRASKEKIEMLKAGISRDQNDSQVLMERIKNNTDMIKHVHEMMGDHTEQARDDQRHGQEMQHDQQKHHQSMQHDQQKAQNKAHVDMFSAQMDMQNKREMQAMNMQHAEDKHQADMKKQAEQSPFQAQEPAT